MHVHAKRIVHLSKDMTAFRLYPHMYGHALPSAAFNATSSLLLSYPTAFMEIMAFSYTRSDVKKQIFKAPSRAYHVAQQRKLA